MATLDTPTPGPAPVPATVADDPRPRRPRRATPVVGKALGYTLMIVAAAAILLPFFWMVVSSLKTNNQVFTVPIQCSRTPSSGRTTWTSGNART
ncbi:hypothetical protein [Cellulosimicrobium sp. CUA-896]|uniref:hypothetical protein n=1 Tax=Cellulosimicrobium sp. CUA-896 TaxID=1517881 RepID=UPI0035151403